MSCSARSKTACRDITFNAYGIMHIKRKRLRAYRMKKSESPLRFRSFFRFSARRFSAVFAVCDAVRGGRPSGGSGCSGFGSAADGLSPRCVKSPPQRAALPARSDKKRRAGVGAERPLCSVPRPAVPRLASSPIGNARFPSGRSRLFFSFTAPYGRLCN